MTGRQYLTDRQWRDLFEQQGEKCARCPERDGPFEADHAIPNHFNPGKPDQILCVPCHRAKTKKDRKDIGHVNRLNGTSMGQRARREDRIARGLKPHFQSRPFPSSKRRARTREEIMNA